jgi:hypothetical protein
MVAGGSWGARMRRGVPSSFVNRMGGHGGAFLAVIRGHTAVVWLVCARMRMCVCLCVCVERVGSMGHMHGAHTLTTADAPSIWECGVPRRHNFATLPAIPVAAWRALGGRLLHIILHVDAWSAAACSLP